MEMNMKIQNTILETTDYRAFLKTRFKERKAQNPNLSVGTLARAVGCSPSFIKRLFAQRVHLGYKFASQIAEALELSMAEKEVLFMIVALNSSQCHQVRSTVERALNRVVTEIKLKAGSKCDI